MSLLRQEIIGRHTLLEAPLVLFLAFPTALVGEHLHVHGAAEAPYAMLLAHAVPQPPTDLYGQEPTTLPLARTLTAEKAEKGGNHRKNYHCCKRCHCYLKHGAITLHYYTALLYVAWDKDQMNAGRGIQREIVGSIR